ncbi:MAG TPA: CoA-binding protein, partial [Burkholderiales bacterium]|nr:CoA-binding protein [Burkholderiales bacterium]
MVDSGIKKGRAKGKTSAGASARAAPKPQAVTEVFDALFRPKTIAVLGASSTGNGRQNVFMRRIQEFGFTGTIYPIHPTASEIDGLPAYRSLAETPLAIDYAQIAIPAA